MLNFTNTADVSKIWDSLGTGYTTMAKDNKAVIETYWKALFSGMQGMYFNLAQVALSCNLSKSWGYIESTDLSITFDFSSADISYLASPAGLAGSPHTPVTTGGIINSYRISAINTIGETDISLPVIIQNCARGTDLSSNPVNLSWTLVAGATGYKIYGRFPGQETLLATVGEGVDTYADHGVTPQTGVYSYNNAAVDTYTLQYDANKILLSIPLLNGTTPFSSGGVVSYIELMEDIDYEIIDGSHLRFKVSPELQSKLVLNNNMETFSIPSELELVPALFNIYYQALGLDTPYDIFKNYQYQTYITPYEGLTKFEQRKLWAKHLNILMLYIQDSLIGGPSMRNLTRGLNYILNVPFSYEAGTVTDISSSISGYQLITVTGENTYTYNIPDSLTLDVALTNQLTPGQFLVKGVKLDDYISDRLNGTTIINSHVSGSNPHEFYYTLAVHIPTVINNLVYNQTIKDFFFSSILPPNLRTVIY